MFAVAFLLKNNTFQLKAAAEPFGVQGAGRVLGGEGDEAVSAMPLMLSATSAMCSSALVQMLC